MANYDPYKFMSNTQAPTKTADAGGFGAPKWNNGGQIDNGPSQTQDQWAQQYGSRQAQAQQAYGLQAQTQTPQYSTSGGGAQGAWGQQFSGNSDGPGYAAQSAQYGTRQAQAEQAYNQQAQGQQPQQMQGGATGYNTGYAPTASAAPAGTGGYRGMSSSDAGGFGSPGRTRELTGGFKGTGVDDPGGRGNTTTPPPSLGPTAQNPGAPPRPSQSWQTSPVSGQPVDYSKMGPVSGGQPAYSQWSPSADYQNADGSWHQNAAYGQQGSDIGRNNPPRQTSGESGPAGGGAAPQWGTMPGLGGLQAQAAGGNPARALPSPGKPDWNAFLPSQNIANYEDQGFVRRTSSLNNATLPFLQASQNAYQYQNDADEAKRRFDMQYGQTGQQNQWQQGFSDRQQTQAEQQAALAGNQWAIQNNQQNVNDNRNYGLSDRNMTMQEQGQQQQYGLAQQAQQTAAQQFQQQQAFQGQQWKDQYGLQQGQLDLSRVQNSQNYGLAQSAQMLDKLKNQQQYGLQDRGMSLQELQNGQQYGLQQGQLDLSRLTQQQQNDLQTGRLSLDQLAQQQNYSIQQGQLGQGNRGLDLQQWQLEHGDTLARDQMAQQMAMQQAQLAQAKEASYMAATGHNQKPNARWLRSTG